MGHGGIRNWVWRALMIVLACLLALFMPPAIPVRAAAGPVAPAGAGTADRAPVNIQLPPILAPMVVSNRLDGYAYITVSLAPAGQDKVVVIREKMPFLQDGFLREVNKSPIVKADDPKAVDAEGVKTRLLARMNQILPAGTVSELKLDQIVLSPLLTSQ